jgi:hypothetical protein
LDLSAILVADSADGELEHVKLRPWLFCYIRMTSGNTFQQFDHALGIHAANSRTPLHFISSFGPAGDVSFKANLRIPQSNKAN